MADNEIQILITAVDDVSKKLDTIKDNLGDLSKEGAKQTTSLANAFDKTQGSLLILGNTAARVDSIFDSYSNMQLRLENANERVANAQDRVNDTQKKLNKLSKEGKKGSEDYADALQEQERATRSLNISENNLARTQNGVTGTYIQMGLSIVTVIASLPTLVSSLASVATALTGVQIAAGPVGWALLGITAAVTGVWLVVNHFKKEEEEAKAVSVTFAKALGDVENSMATLSDEAGRAKSAINAVYSAMKGETEVKSTDELKNLREIASVKNSIAQIDSSGENVKLKENMAKWMATGADAEFAYQLANDESSKSQLENNLKLLEQKQAAFESERNLKQAALELDVRNQQTVSGLYVENVSSFVKSSEEIVAYMRDTFSVNYAAEYKKIHDAQIADLERVKLAYSMITPSTPQGFKASTSSPTSSVPSSVKLNAPSFSGGGTNVTVNIDKVQGTDSDDMADALQKKLKKVR